MKSAQTEELKTEQDGHDDQGSQVPLVSCLEMAAAEIPPEQRAQGNRLQGNDVGKLQEEFAEVIHDIGALDASGVNFFDTDNDAELNAADAAAPEFVDVDVAVDSGAGDNVLA
jgi:hypothetical protein